MAPILTLVPALALAQVNTDALKTNPLEEHLSGSLEGSFALARGNVDLIDVGGAARIQYQTLHEKEEAAPLPFIDQRILLTVNGRLAEKSGAPFISQTFAHARWTAMWHPRVGTEVFAQHQYNKFLLLNVRAIVGTGVRVVAVHLPELMIWGGTGYMFEYDSIDVAPGDPDDAEVFDHRWTNHLAIRVASFEGRLLVQNTLYVQPRFDDFVDLRLLDDVEIVVKVTDRFAFGTTLSVLHDNQPPTHVKPTDLRLSSSVRFSF